MGFMAVRALEALDQAVSGSKALLEQVYAKRFLSALLIYAKLHQAVLASYHDILCTVEEHRQQYVKPPHPLNPPVQIRNHDEAHEE